MPRSRLLVGAVSIAIAITACSSDGTTATTSPPTESTTTVSDTSTTTSEGTTTTTAESTTTTTEATTTTTAPAGNVIEIVLGADPPTSQRVSVPLGEEVTILLSADRVTELHVHGYDIYIDSVEGETVETTFTADIPGVFEIEDHDTGELLVDLEVGG